MRRTRAGEPCWSSEELAAFAADPDHHDPRFIAHPAPAARSLHEGCPVARSDHYGGFWLISRYEDVRRAAKDWRTFTSSVPNVTAIPSSHPRDEPDLPIEIDPPTHTAYRRLVAPVFARTFVDTLKPGITAIASGLIERVLEAGSGDLVSNLTVPLSVGTLASFMGLPAEDRMLWVGWVRRMYDPHDRAGAHAATLEYFAYIDALVGARRAESQADFVSMLLASEIDGRRLDTRDVARFMRVLLIAGHETTAAAMSYMLRHLAESPVVRHSIAENPSLVPTAVEEFLRLSSRRRSGCGPARVSFATSWPPRTCLAAAAHIHRGAVGTAGPVVVPLQTPCTDGRSSGCASAARPLIAAILAAPRSYYVNVHTSAFRAGAIRGQLAGTSTESFGSVMAFDLSGTSEPNAKGRAVIRIRKDAGLICYRLHAENVTLPTTAAHIHRGDAGSNGPVVVPFTAPGADGDSDGCADAAPSLIDEILASRLGSTSTSIRRSTPRGRSARSRPAREGGRGAPPGASRPLACGTLRQRRPSTPPGGTRMRAR